MSIHRTDNRPIRGWLAIGPLLVVLALSGCQAATSPTHTASPSASSATPTQVPTVAPTPSGTLVAPHWEPAGTMSVARDDPHALVLADGSVLVVGNDQSAEIRDASGTWSRVASLDKPRTNFSLVALKDGRAMVVGGMNDIDQSYLSALIFDPAAPDQGWVHASGLLHSARTDPSVVVLADGRVLVAGGYFRVAPEYGSLPSTGTVLASFRGPLADVAPPNVGAAMATAELFDPATEEWTEAGPMIYARYAAAATLLADGRALVVGSGCPGLKGGGVTVDGNACATAEIYDPMTGRFTLSGSLPELDLAGYDFPHEWGDSLPAGSAEFGGTLVPLGDGGAVLIARHSSYGAGGTTIRSYRFDVADDSWRQIGNAFLSWPIRPEGSGPFETPDWVFVTENVVPRIRPLVAPLRDGRVMVAGGNGRPPTTSAELYDPENDAWTSLPPLPEVRGAGAAVTLPDGSIIVVGGHRREDSASGFETFSLNSAIRLVLGSSE